MQTHIASTPFGGRSMSLAQLARQREAAQIPEGKTVNKWQVYRDLCEGRSIIGVGDRSLAVLAALLSFHPDDDLSEDGGLIVFPSNAQLSIRSHGMADATLRRHLAALVSCGVIIRRDSPNGKRYVRKGRGGGFEEAFGFSLAPLLVRADEFAEAADHIRAERRALKLTRERITLLRRDIGKLIEAAIEERVPGDWNRLWNQFRDVVQAIPRRASLVNLEQLVAKFEALRDEVDMQLKTFMDSAEMSGNESQYERHYSNSKTESHTEFEPALESGVTAEPVLEKFEPPKGYPLGLVLRACPEIADYAVDGIGNWRDLMATAAQVRGYLGVSPSAYADALDVMGPGNTAIVIACILQRVNHINSAGGYLRALTEKARAGEFSVGPMLMAALRASTEETRKTA